MKGYLFTDGGARGNRGRSAIGIVLKDADKKNIEVNGKFLGVSTNNNAEYQALIFGLETAKKHGITEIECFLDSELVVKQLKGQYRVKDLNLQNLFNQVKILENEFKHISFTHVLRSLNKDADAIVNKVLDSKAN